MPVFLRDDVLPAVGMRLEGDVVQRDDGIPRKDGKGARPAPGKLKLVRVEPAGRKGLTLIFSQDGEELSWQLAHTSVTEFLALLLRGRMLRGRRVELDDAELAIDPPPEGSKDPQLCLSLGPLEICAPVNRATMKALRADLERASRKPV